ncbi:MULTISPECIES: phosphate ABC transporter permease PstA [unclassified Pseudofrankia]|uniref:phosphate ABC transporter permease PstA n=1 Tax=unclassified Pseudofrankia TaxID=2994372 RepID=UPI0008D983F5|nr:MULTISPECIES: phosphate ABC transporter permease PstA [unclassified Pseudofrankia]MDT3440535.1 phosphate ABC transporter permease PstA [Pseudofrankia sp. BMG5.37]OHV47510.1 phosphate ABC transporter, permease protein PstA [Pseudofrankia sp. BMG5.36]
MTAEVEPPGRSVEYQIETVRGSIRDATFRLAMFFSIGVAIAALGTLLVQVFVDALPRLNLDLLTQFPASLPALAGARSAIIGSIWVIGATALFTIPLGVAAAIYMEVFADPRRWYNRMIEVNIQNLAAVPSIVYGILGLGLLARAAHLGQTVLTAALTLTLLVLPVVIIVSREAMRAIPSSIRDASLALGATEQQTVWRHTLPLAVPGIATGIILALSRAIGEAAPLLLLGGLAYVTFTPTGLDSRFTVLPIQIFNWVSRPQEEFRTLAAAAIVVLLALLLVMNSIAILIRNHYRRTW